MLKNVFVILSFFHYFPPLIGKEYAKESLIIYRNYVLLYVGFTKYFYWHVSYLKQLLWYLENCLLSIWIYNCWKRICSAININMEFYLLKDDFRIRNKYMSMNTQKMKFLPKVTQIYVFSKITTFETLSVMPQSQNSIGNWSFLTVFGNP